MGDEVVGRLRTARSHLGGEKVTELLKGGDMLRVAAFRGLVGRDGENDLAPDVGVIALRQTHGAKEHADRYLAGEIVDELEVLSLAYALERAVCDIESGGNELLDVLARTRLGSTPVADRGGAGRSFPKLRPRGREARRACCLATRRRFPNRASPARCRRSRRGSRGCRFRSSSRDIVRAGFRSTERDRHRFLANRDRMLPLATRQILFSFGFGQGYHGRREASLDG